MSKFSIPMFDGKMDFTMWKMTIEDVLVQQGIDEALEEKQPAEMKYELCEDDAEERHSVQLANVDDAIKDEEQALLMLSSLPKSYKSFVQTMLTGRTILTFEDVLKVEIPRGSSKGRSKSRMGEDRDMSVVECYYYGDTGHMQETPMDGILREEKPKWVLDNAASSHICNDRAMFETLNGKGQFGEIKVGSKKMMKIEGVGSVCFKLHDGSVKTALNVKYVPGAARNILSLGVLMSRGYRYIVRKDTCKVYKRDQLVIRGRKIPNNLCYLEGEALQGRTFCGGNKGKKKIEKRVHFSDKDEHFKDLMVVYFLTHAHEILMACKSYMEGGFLGGANWEGALIDAFVKIGAKDTQDFLSLLSSLPYLVESRVFPLLGSDIQLRVNRGYGMLPVIRCARRTILYGCGLWAVSVCWSRLVCFSCELQSGPEGAESGSVPHLSEEFVSSSLTPTLEPDVPEMFRRAVCLRAMSLNARFIDRARAFSVPWDNAETSTSVLGEGSPVDEIYESQTIDYAIAQDVYVIDIQKKDKYEAKIDKVELENG
ncbi:hypothetical protein Tco_0951025 [Tanacetum coccineum]|uniref:Retrovirus-related Pol polyprotein from transposon TNT 1-94-like beta-barrel domain-containing protein n=1 Tax=Tanacetum coccineum TaxID=301880 RepID=A0ABQ5DTC5_9ASTR